MDVPFWSDVATIVSGCLAMLGVPYALWQIRASRAATSANLVVGLSDSLQAAWRDYTHADNDEMRRYHLEDVFGIVDLIATLKKDGMFTRRSGKYALTILDEHIELLLNDPSVQDRVGSELKKDSELSTLLAVSRRVSDQRS